MVDFSSVNLRILSPDGKQVLAELQTIDRAGQKVSRNVANAGKEAFTDFGNHAALTSRRIAGELSMIAHEGQVSARSLKQVAVEASEAAFAFGPTGIIAGAVALTGVAIFNMFKRTREEIETTAKTARDEIRKISEAGDLVGATRVQGRLFSGDVFAERGPGESDAAFRIRQMGIGPAGAEEDRLRADMLRAQANVSDQGTALVAKMAADRYKEWSEALQSLEIQYIRVTEVVKNLADAEDFRAGKIVENLREQGQVARNKTLEELTRDSGPGVGLLGKPFKNIADMPGFAQSMLDGIQKSLKNAPPLPPVASAEELDRLLSLDKAATMVGESFGQTLANAISTGILAAFQGGGLLGGFKAMTGAILSGLGQMAIATGAAQLAFSIKQKLWKDSVKLFAPEAGIGVALGMIALGAALTAAGGAMGGHAGGSGGGFGGSGFSTSGYPGQVYSLNPVNPLPNPSGIQARESVTVNATFIGTRDPKAARELREMIKYSEKRGDV